jgi:hypothetical protein
VWLPRELVARVRVEARAGKRPTSRQVEFFLEKVLVTSKGADAYNAATL